MNNDLKHKLTLLLEFIFLFIALVMLVKRVAPIFSYNSNISGVEEVFVFYIQKILSGSEFFPDPSQPPYIISQYTPVFFYISALIAKIFKLDPEQNIVQIFWVGRSVSFIANLLTFVFIIKLIRLFRPIRLSYIGLVFILYFGTLTHHNFAVRPDSLKICFLIIGIYYLFKYQLEQKIVAFIIAIVFFNIAIFTKQDAFFESGIILFVFFALNYKSFKKELLITGATFLICGFIFFLCFRNQYLEILLIKSKEHISLNYLKFVFLSYSRNTIVLLILAFVGFLAYYYLQEKKQFLKFLVVLLVPMAIYNVATVAIWGSSFIYVSTTIILLIILFFSVNSKPIAFLFVGFILLFLVRKDTYYTSYLRSISSIEATFKTEHEIRKNIKSIIEIDNPTGEYNILTFDKLLTNYLFETSIFSTYEAEGIEYYYYGSVPMDEYKYFKKIDYDTTYLVKNKEPKYVITNHESQLDLNYNGIQLSDYDELAQLSNFRIFKIKSIQ